MGLKEDPNRGGTGREREASDLNKPLIGSGSAWSMQNLRA